ncbi:glycosyltransferase [Rhodobacteraceae bacterium RKSG542]|uniref:glycosyltransferase family 4 protein n=1 Tax=Pseudovibrio flavus TaxID=2529854 RepID=UPI0012BC7AAD|nr:glycosyltransferase family 4 protein [Pseudovibrio flavus]MTI18201.1 glycosyltransferase [Pseudovibrio flavus]
MKVAVVLPRGMNFSAVGATSIDLVTRDLIENSSYKANCLVIGEAVPDPFKALNFKGIEAKSQKQFDRQCIKALKEFEPKVIVVHQYPETANTIAKSFEGTKVVLYRHGLLKKRSGKIDRFFKGLVFKHLSHIVFVSEFIRQQFLEDYPSLTGRTLVINNAVDVEFWRPAEIKSNTAVYVGRCRRDKGIFELVEGFKKVEISGWKLQLVVAVQTDEEKALFKILSQAVEGEPSISISKNLSSDAVRDVLAEAKIAVLPSIVREGFPRAVVEAMACGCAVIATNRGGTPEAAGDCAILLDEPTPSVIAKALQELSANEAHLAELAEAGRERIATKLRIQTIAKDYDQFLAELAGV